MKKQIKEQLTKITSTTIQFDENTLAIHIPQTKQIIAAALKVGEVYLIELNDYLFNNNLYNVEVVDKASDMTKVNGVAVGDPTVSYFGWLANKDFRVIDKI